MIRVLMLGLVLLAGFASAQDAPPEKPPVYMIALVAFACPSSEELREYMGILEGDLGDRFIFAPVPSSQDTRMERVWYALRDRADADRARDAMYDLLHKMRMLRYSDEELAEWISIQGVAMTGPEIVDAMGDYEAERALIRALRLAERSGIRRVPSFVYLSGTSVIGKKTRTTESASEFIRDGLEMYRQFAGELQ